MAHCAQICDLADASTEKQIYNKIGCARVQQRSSHLTFRLGFQSLHVASSFPCSVASLGRRLEHYLSAQDNLRCRVLTDHMLDLGEPST